MAIKSYLAFPSKGQKQHLILALEQLTWCEVTPAENEDLLIVVAETSSKDDDEAFLESVNKIDSLDHITLVSGFDENQHIN
jgi:nitrate reductase NapAB chaperone NapD